MGKIKCSKCNKKFESNGMSSLCPNCRRKSRTKAYLYIAIAILVLGFIGGIVLGDAFKIRELTYESSISVKYNEYEETFNSALMLYSWIGTLLFDLFVFAVHSICYRLDLLIDKNRVEKIN